MTQTLADAPLRIACRIESLGLAVRDLGRYISAGLRLGSLATVLARYPEHSPRYVEVEVGHDLVLSLPIALAEAVVVTPEVC
jgi:hypothetical protein